MIQEFFNKLDEKGEVSDVNLIGTDYKVFVIHYTVSQVKCSNGDGRDVYQILSSIGSWTPFLDKSQKPLTIIETRFKCTRKP